METIGWYTWLLLMVAGAVFLAYWREHSDWNKHVSDESQRLAIMGLTFFLPPIGMAWMWWDLQHNDRHHNAHLSH